MPMLMKIVFYSSLLSFVLLFGCDPKQDIPALKIKASDRMFTHKEGALYHHGELFSGHQIINYPNGAIHKDWSYLNGWKSDTSYCYFQNGKVSFKRYYENGKLEGTATAWYKNDQKKYEYHYKNGLHEGPFFEWYSTGVLAMKKNYKDGTEFGLQQGWSRKGKINSNYEFRNGRKYGVLGRFDCITTKDEINTTSNEI